MPFSDRNPSMIRVICPKCEKRLSVSDSQAGGVGNCPECGQKFRIPGTKPAESSKSQPAKPAAMRTAPAQKPQKTAPPAQPARPTRPKEDWEEEDSSPYEVQEAQQQTEAAKMVAR